MTQRLSEVEIRALARAFNTPGQAKPLLVRAGLTYDQVPVFIGTPYDYWSEISAQLEYGLLEGGREQILAAAAKMYPGNQVFKARAERPTPAGSPFDTDAPPALPLATRGSDWPSTGMSEHASVFFLDARRYSGRTLPGQISWREALRSVVAAAVEGLRLPAESIRLLQDHGDGLLGVLAGSVGKERLASDFVRELQIAQRTYNDGREPDSRLRLRMSLHHGDVVVENTGAPGDPVVVAARLIEAAQVRGMLERYPDADLVLALSPEYYRSTVAQRLRDLDPAKFREIDVTVADKYAGTAWVTLPGHASNPPVVDDPVAPPSVDAQPVNAQPAGIQPAGSLPASVDAAPPAGAELSSPRSAAPPATRRSGGDEVRRRIADLWLGREHSASPPPFPGDLPAVRGFPR